ncbi:LytTR family DNA-binding domain-containing protein [uncultured Ruegeria sp.]|uniref:LytTR family DNA-binding domain-containing protein n=1 Tax=uncultured Ruegeria sp. TaxID=259304 RepID=UPI002626C746|nr:LytTR family DNA-binding domain-containing protein [uncultured Ruegeria sp.]
MTSKIDTIRKAFTPQRVMAGLVFLPLLAYAFPPFLVADLTFGLRLLFWTGVMVLALTVTGVARKLMQKNPVFLNVPARDVAFAALILVLFTPSLWMLAWVLFTCGGHMAPGAQTVAVYGVLFATGLVLVQRGDRNTSMDSAPEIEKPRLVRRLPPNFDGQIHRLTVRDHNVDVVTSEGTFTVRSRFTDAIAEMEPVPGHCSHRSHWVVDASIVCVEKSGGKTFLRLMNDDLVPVSRKYKPMLEEDGLI